MKLKSWQKNVLSIIFVVVIGFVLFNIAFLLASVVINTVDRIVGRQGETPQIGLYIFLVIILIISWFIFRSRLNDLIKATYLALPLMTVLLLEGILLYTQPQWLTLLVGAAIIGAVLFYLIKKKLSWLYYFSTFYVLVLGIIIAIFNIEI